MQNIFYRTCLYGACFLGAIAAAYKASPTQAQMLGSGSITVEVTGLRNSTGQVCFSLFDSSRGFPDNAEAIVTEQCVEASEFVTAVSADETVGEDKEIAGDHTVIFEDLAPGNYAVSIIHDENEDGTINTGTFGIPTEGFGFSRNPDIQTRAPRFSEAAVLVVGRNTTAPIELIYY